MVDDQGQPVSSFTYQPNAQGLQVTDVITYELGGQELFAVLCRNYSMECYLFILDVQGTLYADWVYPIQHPTASQNFNAEHVAWNPQEERLAILGHVNSYGPAYDVGLFTTDGLGEIVDEMRWYDFKTGSTFNSSQAIGLEYDPWSGGFLVGIQTSAWGVGAGFMLFPVSYTGDPQNAHTPWITKAFRGQGFSLDLTHDQVLVYGEDFAFGPGVSYSDVCLWMDDASNILSGVTATPDFTRLANSQGALEKVRDGAFGAVNPGIYSIIGLSDNVTALTYFEVSPGAVAVRSRVSSNSFGYVGDLLHLQNFAVNGAGFGLDQIVTGWTNGYYTAFSRRPSTGELDPWCETRPHDLDVSQEPHGLLYPSILVEYTFKQGGLMGSGDLKEKRKHGVVCDYPGFASGKVK